MKGRYKIMELTMARGYAWEGGFPVTGAKSAEEALKMAHLDFDVKQEHSYYRAYNDNGKKVDDNGRRYDINVADTINYRSDNGMKLGTVGNRYVVVPNTEALSFIDNLIGQLNLETAGELNDGKMTWLLAHAGEYEIADDKFYNYILFANSYDGKSSVKVLPTNTRVVCRNTFNLALRNADRIFSFSHKGDINSKLAECAKTLKINQQYKEALIQHANKLVTKKVSRADVKRLLDAIFPIEEEMSKTAVANKEKQYENFFTAYKADDLNNIRDTRWGLLNAVSDMAYHSNPLRKSKTSKLDRGINFLVKGNSILDTAFDFLMQDIDI